MAVKRCVPGCATELSVMSQFITFWEANATTATSTCTFSFFVVMPTKLAITGGVAPVVCWRWAICMVSHPTVATVCDPVSVLVVGVYSCGYAAGGAFRSFCVDAKVSHNFSETSLWASQRHNRVDVPAFFDGRDLRAIPIPPHRQNMDMRQRAGILVNVVCREGVFRRIKARFFAGTFARRDERRIDSEVTNVYTRFSCSVPR